MTDYIQPKPTPYEGVLYKSRLEANWAVFFTSLGVTFDYEPYYLELPNNLGTYTPDFGVRRIHSLSKENHRLILEVKPKEPQGYYLNNLRVISESIASKEDLWLAVGSFFKDNVPFLAPVDSWEHALPLTEIGLVGISRRRVRWAVRKVKQHRWDI